MSQRPRHVFLFDMTRHRSHLFFRYLGTHPDIHSVWHPFLQAAVFGPERLYQHTKNVDLDGNRAEWTAPSGSETYAIATNKFLDAIKDADAQEKILVANEHTQLIYKQDIVLAMIRSQDTATSIGSPNPTLIPDHIFSELTPIFVIRNPVHAVPSNYISYRQTSKLRLGGEDWQLLNCIYLQRRLFDQFSVSNSDRSAPIIVDGDDVIWRTDQLRDSLSQALGLDPKGISTAWQAVPDDQRSKEPIVRYFLQTIDDSTGIVYPSEQRPDADLDASYRKWVVEYGQEVADQLRATVEENMPHYEYMVQFKV